MLHNQWGCKRAKQWWLGVAAVVGLSCSDALLVCDPPRHRLHPHFTPNQQTHVHAVLVPTTCCRFGLPEPEAVFSIGFFRRNPKPFHLLAKELFPGGCGCAYVFVLGVLFGSGRSSQLRVT